ncbi:sensor histidine kinase [bacterium]
MKIPLLQYFIDNLRNPLPKEYAEEYHDHYGAINLFRLRWALIFMLGWSLIMVISDIQAMDELQDIPNFQNFLWIDTVIFLSGIVLYLITRKISNPSSIQLKKQFHSFIFFCSVFFMCIGAVISGMEYEATRGAPSYIIAVFFIGTIFELSNLRILIAYAISTTVLILIAGLMSQGYSTFILKNMSLFVLVFFGWFNARVLSLNRRRLFLERKRLAESNLNLTKEVTERKQAQHALQKAHDVLEDRVEERTEALNQQNIALENTIREKNVLLQEVYHRVKNNLQIIISLLNLHAQSLGNVQLKKAFLDSQNRIRSMALIHEKLYQSKSYAHVDFRFYIQDLVYTLFRSFQIAEDEIKFDIQVESVSLPLNIAVPCGLIINELISNILKYAFPKSYSGKKEVSIRFQKIKDESLELIIKDNGVGLCNDKDEFENPTLGQELIELLAVQQLNGTVEVQVKDGTTTIIHFPSKSDSTSSD